MRTTPAEFRTSNRRSTQRQMQHFFGCHIRPCKDAIVLYRATVLTDAAHLSSYVYHLMRMDHLVININSVTCPFCFALVCMHTENVPMQRKRHASTYLSIVSIHQLPGTICFAAKGTFSLCNTLLCSGVFAAHTHSITYT